MKIEGLTLSFSQFLFGQIMSGSITAYLSEMGVDVKLFQLTNRAGREQIYRISVEEARALGVANNGFLQPKWSIEAIDQGLYLRGAQEAWYGLGRVTFLCGEKAIFFTVFYSAGSFSDRIISETKRHSLRLDDEFVDIGKPIVPLSVKNGVISAMFTLPMSIIERIKSARSVGYAAHTANPAIFAGFTVEIGSGDRQKITGYFTQQCLSAHKK